MKLKNDHRSKFYKLKLERRSLKKNQGFHEIQNHDLCDTGAMLYQLSYGATHWERVRFIEFISSYLYIAEGMGSNLVKVL